MTKYGVGLFRSMMVLAASFAFVNCWMFCPGKTVDSMLRQQSALRTCRGSFSRLRGDLRATQEGEANRSPEQKTKTKKNRESTPHWLNETDSVQVEFNGDNLSVFRFKVRGNPRPLVRHRTGRGFMYNPSAVLQESFRREVLKIITAHKKLEPPLFRQEDSLVMSVVLRMKRPKSHFVNNKPGLDRLKATAPAATAPTRTDTDNLIKFVLDSMNEILYPDDRQIASLHVTRLLDNEGLCEGSTEICLRTIDDSDCETLMDNSFRILEP